ncbi:MAG: hypothetical protein KKF33_20525 [Alphaproteobacteria bacterium]|nr:hypothetical protein [Alphaproteobacteria bacterium]
MYLPEMLAALRTELQDTAEDIYTPDELLRAIEKCISLLARFIPKRDIVETTLVRTITDETLTIASSTGTLACKPIKVGSVVMTGKTLDTDYRINYLTGVVTEIGSLLPDTDYTVSYKLDPHMLNISSLLPDYIRIERYEYPAGDSPPTLITGDVFGDFIVFRGDVTLTEDYHLRIVYLGRWTAPTPTAAGDYPSHLDDTIIIGSTGQALIFKAEKYVQEAKTLLSTAETTLASMTAPLGDADAALDEVGAEIAAGKSYLETGNSLINAATWGDRVGENYAVYAATLMAAANTYVAEAVQRANIASEYQNKGSQEVAIALQLLTIAGRYLSSGQAKINEFLLLLGLKPEFQTSKALPEQRA